MTIPVQVIPEQKVVFLKTKVYICSRKHGSGLRWISLNNIVSELFSSFSIRSNLLLPAISWIFF